MKGHNISILEFEKLTPNAYFVIPDPKGRN
jgi:hypothetical protein